MEDDEFYMSYSPSHHNLLIIRKQSSVLVRNYPEEFWQQAKDRHPVKKTLI